ncbi:MAG: hypothetical protein V1690_01420 [Candidatus Moraniibacteriota bacterium]
MKKLKKPFILFITGISGSGKSTMFKGLKKASLGSNVEVHDIDEDGVPFGGRVPWRKYRVLNLFYEAIKKMGKGKSTVICGISLPFEVIDSDYYKPGMRVYFLLLETSYQKFWERTAVRFEKRGEKTDPLKFKFNNKDLAVRLLNQASSIKNNFSVDSSKNSKQKVLKETIKIIQNL